MDQERIHILTELKSAWNTKPIDYDHIDILKYQLRKIDELISSRIHDGTYAAPKKKLYRSSFNGMYRA